MYVEDPRRLATVLALLAALLVGGWWLLLRDPGTELPGRAAPAAAAKAPADVQAVLDAAARAPRGIVTVRTKNTPVTRRVFDTPRGYLALYQDGKLMHMQRGKRVYARVSSCFQKSASSTPPAGSAFAAEFLPSGSPELSYVTAPAGKRLRIRWSAKVAGVPAKDAPSGVVLADATSKLPVSATLRPTRSETTVSYPERVRMDRVPSRICKTPS